MIKLLKRQKAFNDQSSLRDAVVNLGFLSAEDFDRYVKPEEMIHPKNHKINYILILFRNNKYKISLNVI